MIATDFGAGGFFSSFFFLPLLFLFLFSLFFSFLFLVLFLFFSHLFEPGNVTNATAHYVFEG